MRTRKHTITIKHTDGDVKHFNNDADFIYFTVVLFAENEETNTALKCPETLEEAQNYLKNYCEAWVLQ